MRCGRRLRPPQVTQPATRPLVLARVFQRAACVPRAGGWGVDAAARRARLKEGAGKLMGQLYDRNCRRAFAPAEAFQADSLPLDRFQAEVQVCVLLSQRRPAIGQASSAADPLPACRRELLLGAHSLTQAPAAPGVCWRTLRSSCPSASAPRCSRRSCLRCVPALAELERASDGCTDTRLAARCAPTLSRACRSAPATATET